MSDFSAWYKEQQSAANPSASSSSLPLYSSLSSSATSQLSSLQSSFQASLPGQDASMFGLDYSTRFRLFVCLLLLSLLFFALGFVVGLPALALRPQKFALCFTFGSLTFMGSFSMLSGPAAHLRSMLSPDRLAFTGVYLSTTFSTLYLTFSYGGVSGYFLVLASTCLQLLALVWYLVTFIPGGSRGLGVLAAGMGKMVQPVARVCAACWAQCLRTCMGS